MLLEALITAEQLYAYTVKLILTESQPLRMRKGKRICLLIAFRPTNEALLRPEPACSATMPHQRCKK